jgi:hypothetical protein
MPNILKRPMFRKGGSTSDGVGITSGLRKNYAEGTPGITIDGKFFPFGEEDKIPQEAMDIAKKIANKPMTDEQKDIIRKSTTMPMTKKNSSGMTTLSDPSFDLIRSRYQELKPTRKTNLQDLVTALGATAPEDATKLQTIGQVLSKAGTTAAGLRQQREATAEAFKSGALTEVLKNMNAEDKDQLIRRAKEYARLNNIPEDQAINMFLSKLLQPGGSDYLKDYSPQVRARQIGEKLVEDGYILGGNIAEQTKAGNLWYLYQTQQLPQQAQETLSGTTYPNDIVIDYESGTGQLNPDKPSSIESRYIPNKSYVNPADGGIYLYEGDGQFKKIYP